MNETIKTLNSIRRSNHKKYMFGIEVSQHTGYIDMSEIIDKYDYIYLRLGVFYCGSDRLQIDDNFYYYYTMAKHYKIPIGVYVYIFSNVLTIDKIDIISNIIISELDTLSFEYPLMLDIEPTNDIIRDSHIMRQLCDNINSKNYFTICNDFVSKYNSNTNVIYRYESIYNSTMISIYDRYVKTKSEKIFGILTDINNINETSELGKAKYLIAGFVYNLPLKRSNKFRNTVNDGKNTTDVVCTVVYKDLDKYIKTNNYKNWKG